MSDLVQVSLDGGGSILIRSGPIVSDSADGGPVTRSGPVRAGRVGDTVEEIVEVASCSLRDALEPVTRMSQQVLEQLSQARPREVTVEFGVELTAQAGAVLAKAGAGMPSDGDLDLGPGRQPVTSDG